MIGWKALIENKAGGVAVPEDVRVGVLRRKLR